MRIDVIIPVLNEEARIARQIRAVSRVRGLNEIIVVDGGSTDRTLAIARAHRGVSVLESPRGRAVQMNRGARVATGDVLLFLHADVTLPGDAATWVARALGDRAVVAGAFRTFTIADGERPRFGPLLRLADIRSRVTSLPYGDQAIFVRAAVFRCVGGFPEIPIMEDVEFCRRARRVGKIRTVPANVRVSGRRFIARPIYATAMANVIPALYRLGIPARFLAGLYGSVSTEEEG
ncbi:MAG: TIGR04283 family arsenosugar biosynthesis glycosyltransferase [Deltaproteobacteria bacterium]|nr:TIGR04283 family arsenosugar biosynthesis glycosyltransferase [Deltaproteobacteria bacterium]